MKQLKLIIVSLLFNTTQAYAESYDNQVWLNVTLQGPLSTDSKLGASLELQPRYSDKQQQVFEALLRPALYYKTDELGTFHLGYLSRTNSDNKEIEKRYWTQWSKSYGLDSYKLFSRIRYEIRDLNLSDNSQRVRLMGRVLKNDLDIVYGYKPLVAVELFYNINDVNPSIKSGFKHSRNSVGLSRKFENNVTSEFLLTKNYIDSAIAEDQDNNVLQIILIKEF
ncbi:MAG: DUF2490 domain-containing protein [Bdellovibrionaceae bacterium]|nr:DUF2490 domain-containing protein [Pseudobdellovibrionaceae bacterium]